MAKKLVVKTCQLVQNSELSFTINRVFLVPKCYRNLDKYSFCQELRRKMSNPNLIFVAYKFGETDMKTAHLGYEFKEVVGVEMQDISDWYIQEMFADLEIQTLDRRIDPVILFLGDKKRLQFRINYYLDLLKRGYSEDEAMQTIF